MGLRHLHGIDTGVDSTALPAISALVAAASGRPVAANKSIVGEAVFTHESGIHVDGLLKDRANYQGFDPAEVGRDHRLVLGKHSGSAGVRDSYVRLGLPLTDGQAERLLERIRAHVTDTKQPPDRDTLIRLYLEHA